MHQYSFFAWVACEDDAFKDPRWQDASNHRMVSIVKQQAVTSCLTKALKGPRFYSSGIRTQEGIAISGLWLFYQWSILIFIVHQSVMPAFRVFLLVQRTFGLWHWAGSGEAMLHSKLAAENCCTCLQGADVMMEWTHDKLCFISPHCICLHLNGPIRMQNGLILDIELGVKIMLPQNQKLSNKWHSYVYLTASKSWHMIQDINNESWLCELAQGVCIWDKMQPWWV